MNRKELEQLIDSEVSKVFSDMVSREPQKKQETPEVKTPTQTVANLTEDELDTILFYTPEEN